MNEFMPPNDNDIEQIVLAGLMVESQAILENKIRAEWFYKEVFPNNVVDKQLLFLSRRK